MTGTGLRTITPKPDTPTKRDMRERGMICDIEVWFKGCSVTHNGRDRSPYNERAAYIVSVLLNLKIVPLTVLCLVGDEVVSAQKWVQGEEWANDDAKPPELLVFDYIIDNSDRHGGNWFAKQGGDVWAIDNAFSFRNPAKYRAFNGEVPENIKQKIHKALKREAKFYARLNGLIGEDGVAAVLERMKKVIEV